MRFLIATPLPLLLCAFVASVNAIAVAPSSPCAIQCGNVLTSTSGTDLVCGDTAYSSAVGQTFQNCITCELNSTYTDPTTKETDLQWLLYNLRYSAAWCVWGYPNNPNAPATPCVTHFACGTLENAIKFDNLATNTTEYGYCSQWDFDLVSKCSSCLSQASQTYLANFFTALTAGCQQESSPDSLIALDGTLFQENLVNITTPVNSSLPVYTPQPAGPISLGAKVGIAIGGLVFLTSLAGCFIVCRGKHRRRAHLRRLAEKNQPAPEPKWREHSSPGSESNKAFMAPDNQRWQGGNDDSPQSLRAGDHVFSPYQSQYASPISPDGARMFPPVPIPLPYDRNARRKSDAQHMEGEAMSPGNLIELNPIRRSSTATAPIIKEPVPIHVRRKSEPQPAEREASATEITPSSTAL